MMRETATACGQQPQSESGASAIRDALAGNINFALELAIRIERLADLVVGPVPETDAASKLGSGPDCFLREIRLGEDAVRASLFRISGALDRMERDFG